MTGKNTIEADFHPSPHRHRRRPGIIFLMRHPPGRIGGVQTHSSRLASGLGRSFEVERITCYGPLWASILYSPGFYLRSACSSAQLVHCDDALTSLVGSLVRSGTGKRVVATVHGMDVIMPIPWYQRMLKRALTSMDAVVCVSRATAEEVRKRGVDPRRIEIIPNSAEVVRDPLEKNEKLYQGIQQLTGIDLRGKKVLFSLGRPIRRKGFDYFIREVFPHLPPNCVYIAAGPSTKALGWAGPFTRLVGEKWHHLALVALGRDTVHEKLVKLSQRPRIYYLNDISDQLRNMLYYASDLFIMPNRRVEGDMEGFGIVALEASARGVPVVATGIEGITDAVVDGKNGYCVPEGDPEAMARTIRQLLENKAELLDLGKRAAEFSVRQFSSESITRQYESLFARILRVTV